MKKTAMVGLGACAVALAFAAKDPVIMTVNGVDVPQSEFEYLYNKNSQQQINPQTLDEYVEMFKLYKMKVADALAEGLDTMASFKKETDQYRHDLAVPYLTDSVYLNSLVREAYDRTKEEVVAKHIMIFKTRDMAQNVVAHQRADSILGVLKAGGDFEELARKYSQDRGSSSRGGTMGWITSGSYPEAFEAVAYTLPEGQISEVVESPFGYHILKGGQHRPARGKVQVSHILKLTQGKDEAGVAKARQEIDSIYRIVANDPTQFAAVATNNSDDRGSARQGGMLPVFGAGEMVAEFDSVSFALPVGAISEPFKTSYGYHIVYKHKNEPVPAFESVKPQLESRITSAADPRHKLMIRNQNAKLAKKHKGALNDKTLAKLRADVTRQGLDSMLFANWTTGPDGKLPLTTVDGKTTTAGDFMKGFDKVRIAPSTDANENLEDNLDAYYNSLLVNAEELSLEKTEPDYRNLLKEYVDGSLLYEVSVRKVWDKAAKDTEGLRNFFERNRSNYKWSEPHAKGFLVQTTNDSVASLIKTRAASLPADSLVQILRKEFKGNATVDRVLVSKGTNAMIDNILFGGPEVQPSNSKYHVYFMIEPRVITEPEEVNDVKGLVTSDYQNEFQTAWENELRSKYPVVVNEKVLKKIKKSGK